jgi:hypothetical protein
MVNHKQIKDPSVTSESEPASGVWFEPPVTMHTTEKAAGIPRAETLVTANVCRFIAPVRSYRRELMAVLMWFVVSLGTAGHPHGKATSDAKAEESVAWVGPAQAPEQPKAAPTCECLTEAAAPPVVVESVAPAEPVVVAEPSPPKRTAHASRRKHRAKVPDELQRAAQRLLRERIQRVCGARIPSGETRIVNITLSINFIERNVVGAAVAARKPGAVERCVLDEVNAKISRGWGTFHVKPIHKVRYRLRGRRQAA